jgi:hypothetical protein
MKDIHAPNAGDSARPGKPAVPRLRAARLVAQAFDLLHQPA